MHQAGPCGISGKRSDRLIEKEREREREGESERGRGRGRKERERAAEGEDARAREAPAGRGGQWRHAPILFIRLSLYHVRKA